MWFVIERILKIEANLLMSKLANAILWQISKIDTKNIAIKKKLFEIKNQT